MVGIESLGVLGLEPLWVGTIGGAASCFVFDFRKLMELRVVVSSV